MEILKDVSIGLSKHDFLGATRGAAISHGHSRGAAEVPVTDIPLRFEQRLDGLWQVESEADVVQLPQVDYMVTGIDGEAGYFTTASEPFSRIRVDILPLPPRRMQTSGNTVTWTGDAILYLDLSKISVAGNYSGTIRIIVEYE